MLGNLLEKKLKDLKDRKIVVVMTDGLAFIGTLADFDKTTLVLRDISQTQAANIEWEDISSEKVSGEGGVLDITGYIDWTAVKLKEVYIQTAHITRIWPGQTFETEESAAAPIYYRTQKPDINRALGMDIPGGIL